MLSNTIKQATQSVRDVVDKTVDTAIVLGSGLSEMALDGYNTVAEIEYSNIQGLPESTAPSHKGTLSILTNGKTNIALCAGRHHLYEGYSAQQVATLTYLMKGLGASNFIITNAAGALNAKYQPGDIMLINDHINFTGHSPLIGQDEKLGVRFPDMSRAYSPALLGRLQEIASQQGTAVHSGVYLGVSGPSLETSAERRMFAQMGADAIGMSTVLEVIAAKHVNMRVLGISAITNMALGDEHQGADTVEEVLEHAAIAGEKIAAVLNRLLQDPL